MAGIFQFFTDLLAKIAGLAKWFLAVFKQIFIDAWNIITDAFCWLFDSALGIAIGAVSAIEAPFNPQTYYGMIPPDVVNMLGAIGITQALTIVVGALIIRFILQLIPFVRLGS